MLNKMQILREVQGNQYGSRRFLMAKKKMIYCMCYLFLVVEVIPIGIQHPAVKFRGFWSQKNP